MLAQAAYAPEQDGRYRDRIAFDRESGQASRDAYDRIIPDDPSVLNIGRAHGRESQLSAVLVRTALPEEERLERDVMRQSPDRFQHAWDAVNDYVPMEGAERAQQFTDLSRIARHWENPTAEHLMLSFAGQAMWHLIHAASPTNTAQFPDEAVLERTEFLYLWRAFLTSGGYLAPLESRRRIASRLAQNIRRFVQLRQEARKPTILSTLLEGEPLQFTSPMDDKHPPAQFPQRLTRSVAKAAALDLPEMTSLVRRLACGRIFSDGYRIKAGAPAREAPTAYSQLVCTDDAAAQVQLDALIAKSWKRAASAVNAYYLWLTTDAKPTANEGDGSEIPRELLVRFLRDQLDALDAEDARRAKWQASEPSVNGLGDNRQSIAWPVTQGGLLATLALWFWWVIRRPLPPMKRMLEPSAPTESAPPDTLGRATTTHSPLATGSGGDDDGDHQAG